jgi:hypothetical protein
MVTVVIAAAHRRQAVADVIEGVFKLLPDHDVAIGPVAFP